MYVGNHLEREIAYNADFFSLANRAINDLYCSRNVKMESHGTSVKCALTSDGRVTFAWGVNMHRRWWRERRRHFYLFFCPCVCTFIYLACGRVLLGSIWPLAIQTVIVMPRPPIWALQKRSKAYVALVLTFVGLGSAWYPFLFMEKDQETGWNILME